MALSTALVFACSGREPLGGPPPARGFEGSSGGHEGGLGAGDASGPPSPDADGVCGNQVHALIIDAPNIYFVLDASGSMSAGAQGGGSRYEAVRGAAIELVRSLGPRINVGAAVFPRDATGNQPCHNDVLGDIASVVVSCDFALADSPQDPGLTNVYLDQEVLAYGSVNGWTWAPGSVVRLLGGACERVKHAEVKQVQIVSGCPTEVAK